MPPTATKTELSSNPPSMIILTLITISIIAIVLIGIAFDRLGLRKKSCENLNLIYSDTPLSKNTSYFNSRTTIKPDAESIFGIDNSNNTLINFYVKSAYNCCCGDGYKDNFVDLCALERCIANGCRFLDFEIYSYNNDPIIASSTANSNYIKETYNALLLSEVLASITDNAFDGIKTNSAMDPLILNFRVMSTNKTMLEKMGDLFQEYLDRVGTNFSLLNAKDAAVINSRMSDLRQKIIIICDFNPSPNIIIDLKLAKLKTYINLNGKGLYCNTYRFNDIVAKGSTNTQFITETRRKYTIVLPNLDNSTPNFDSINSWAFGCQAICMKHQKDPKKDTDLDAYNKRFEDQQANPQDSNSRIIGSYSWRFKG